MDQNSTRNFLQSVPRQVLTVPSHKAWALALDLQVHMVNQGKGTIVLYIGNYSGAIYPNLPHLECIRLNKQMH